MENVLRQTDKPLFPAILWEAPQTKSTAKKILIIGGHQGQINDVQQAYASVIKAGIGQAKIILPDKLRPVVGQNEDILYLRSTRSGSLDKSNYPEISAFIHESDGLLIAGGLSNHPDSASLLEDIFQNSQLPIILNDQILNLVSHQPKLLWAHPQRLLVSNTQGLVKLANYLELPLHIQPRANLINKISLLKEIQKATGLYSVLVGSELIVCGRKKTSLTQLRGHKSITEVAAYMAVYYLQHPKKFAALTTAAWQLKSSA